MGEEYAFQQQNMMFFSNFEDTSVDRILIEKKLQEQQGDEDSSQKDNSSRPPLPTRACPPPPPGLEHLGVCEPLGLWGAEQQHAGVAPYASGGNNASSNASSTTQGKQLQAGLKN